MTHSVLIVDDNRISRESLQTLLTSVGWQVDTRENGIQALQACEQHRFDAVITGYSMPVIDGPHLLGLLKNRSDYQNVPVVMLSTRDQQEVARHTNMEQLAFFLSKPLNCESKQMLLERLLAVVVATKDKAA